MEEEEENTFKLQKHLDILESLILRCEDGAKTAKWIGKCLQQGEDFFCYKENVQLAMNNSLFSTQECPVINKKMILKDRNNTLENNVQLMCPTSNNNIIKISHPDLISEEEALLPFWKESKKDLYTQLSWLQKIDWQGLDSSSLNGYVVNTEQKSWFLKTTITLLPKNLEKTCCPSFRYIVVNGTDEEGTKKKEKKVKKHNVKKKTRKGQYKKKTPSSQKIKIKEEEDENSITKCMKLRIYPNTKQKEMLNKWVGCSRFTYNTVLSDLKCSKNCFKSWMSLRNRYVTGKYRSGTKNSFFNQRLWLLETPKSIRLEAVKECWKNRKACFSNRANGHIKTFDMEFKSKKKEQKNGWSLGVEKNNVSREDDKLYIFPTIFGEIKYGSTKQLLKLIVGKHPMCDPRIQKDRYGDYYLVLPIKVKITSIQKKEHDTVTSVDKGVKIFASCYDPKGQGVFYGKDVDQQFLTMLEDLDDKISHRDSFQGNPNKKKIMNDRIKKHRKRIMNYKKELHHQFNNYLTKNYSLLICPKLDTQKMSLKERRKLRTKTVRSMLNLGHCSQHSKLIVKCKERCVEMISPSEAYTTKTCPLCGIIKECTSNRLKKCACGYVAERDLNGALNILLRSLN